MRLALLVAVFGTLALAGAAQASDYMLPVLLREKVMPPQPSAPGGAPAAPQADTSTLVSNTGLTMTVALVGALVVVAVFFLAVRRADGNRA